MQRRNALQRLIAGTAVLAVSALPYGLARLLAPDAEAAPGTHLRPPGALANDAAFVQACIGCGLCGEVCPPRCIRFFDLDGVVKVNTH